MADSDLRTGPATPMAGHTRINGLDWISLILMIIGGINWGLVGAFDLDLVATLFGSGTMISRIVYILVGLAGLYGLILLARLARDPAR